jgi:hypothetical protein
MRHCYSLKLADDACAPSQSVARLKECRGDALSLIYSSMYLVENMVEINGEGGRAVVGDQ